MADKLVPTVQTPFSMREISRLALVHAPELDKAAVGVLWAQFATECGSSGEHCYGHNLGNIKHFTGDGYDFHSLKGVWEVINGKTVIIDAGAPGSWFRAHADFDAGFRDQLRFLQGKRYGSTWPHVVAGDPDTFARTLGACGYFTAPPDHYARNMVALHRRWMLATAFDEERPTAPSIVTADQLEPEPAIVHPRVEFGTETRPEFFGTEPGPNSDTDPTNAGNE